MTVQRKFVYEHIRDELIDMINRDKYQIGDKLPSERALAAQFTSNYHTVRKALRELSKAGIIEKFPARGSFVKRVPKYMIKIDGRFKLLPENHNGIGVIYQKKSSHFNADLIYCLSKEAEKQGFFLITREIDRFDNKAVSLSRQLLYQGCFAILLLPNRQISSDYDVSEFTHRSVLPTILPTPYSGAPESCIRSNETYVSYTERKIFFIGEYLLKCGYQRIGFLGPAIRDEIEETLFYFARFGCSFNNETLTAILDGTPEMFDKIANDWKPHAGKLGVICYDDEYAFKFINALQRQNVRVPEDIGVVGCNNAEISKMSNPAISTMLFPYIFLSDRIIEFAMSLRSGVPKRCIDDLQTDFIIRDSCGARLRLGDQFSTKMQSLKDNYPEFNFKIERK